MIKIPFVPQPYPDEILGSWLARVALLNGKGAWKVLLEASGFNRKVGRLFFDMPVYDTKVDTFLSHLGYSYDDALWNLSTYPYWATFESSRSEFMKGSSTAKALINKGKVVSHINRLGHQFNLATPIEPWFCSLCLTSDYSNFGEPFWHKSHQLPTVYYCPTHDVPLQNKCTACGIFNVTGGKRMMPLPRLTCSCGYDYTKQTKNIVRSNEIYKRLTKVSIDALENRGQNWSVDNVKAYFDNIAIQKLGPRKGETYIKIKEIFKAEEISNYHFTINPSGYIGPTLYHRNPTLFRASEYCMILASMDIDFTNAAIEFSSSFRQTLSQPNHKKLPGIPDNVDFALTELSKRLSQNPNQPAASHKMLYWYLKIKAIDKLKILIPNMIQQSIPTLAKDRAKILNWASKKTKLYCREVSYLRASIRDSAWLESLKMQQSTLNKQNTKNSKQGRDDLLLKKMKQKIHEIVNKENRPERITLTGLGTHIGFSAGQMTLFVKKHPELTTIVKFINDDKFRRQLVWAANELKANGIVLSEDKIYRKASLRYSTSLKMIVDQLLIDN